MNFNDHSRLEGQHSFLSASQYHWINYSEEKLATTYRNTLAKLQGTLTHEFAATCIQRGQKLPSRPKTTLSLFVNDAIGYKMTPEQILYYSDNAFGTTDAISFRNNFLRIHDLKTGETKAHFEQLMIYAAYFCLEYHVEPENIGMELRIYQYNDVEIMEPEASDIQRIMEKIVASDRIIEKLKAEVM